MIAIELKLRTLVVVFLISLSMVSEGDSYGSEKGGGKPKKGMGRKRPANGKLQNQRKVVLFNVDVFAGPSMNFVSGDYIDYQKEYYQEEKTKFPTNGSLKSYIWVTGGAQVRINPIEDTDNPLSMLSVSAGASYLQKGFTHDVTLQNKNLKYDDFTNLKETFKAHYISIPIMVRFGGALYAEGGICLDLFMNGIRKQEINRWAPDGDTASNVPSFQEGYYTGSSITYKLPSSLMKKMGLGYCFGFGYNFTPMFGVRLYNTMNSKFFNDLDMKNFQTSLQAIVTFN